MNLHGVMHFPTRGLPKLHNEASIVRYFGQD